MVRGRTGAGGSTPVGSGIGIRRSARLAALFATTLFLLAGSAQAAGPPQVDATWVTDVTTTSANLHGQVNPEGLATSYRFEYITEADYQANLGGQPPRDGFAGAVKAPSGAGANLGSASTDQPALQHVTGLKPSTAYRYRILATNSAAPAGIAGATRTLATEESSPSLGLPDRRGWEMVSPADKNGGAIQGFGINSGGDVLQAAASGEAATFSSASSFGAEAQGAPSASQYISRRSETGWSTENITRPTLSGAYGNADNGVPYQLFSGDLARGLLLNGSRCGEAEGCPRSYSRRESAGGELTLSPEAPGLAFAGSSPDLSHLIFSTCAALTAEATEVPGGGGGCDPLAANLYQWSGGAQTLINVLPGESKGTPGAVLAAQDGAVSVDGSRIYWSEGGNLYLRESGHTVQVDESLGGGGRFETASANGAVAFFTKAGHLYRYEVSGAQTTDLTPGGEVLGVLGASEDGSHLYYVTASGLFLWDEGTTTEVAAAVDPGDYPSTTGTARVSPDGAHLAFLSRASLTGYDNSDAASGVPDSEVYLYDAGSGQLRCVSCNPTGERPRGPSSITGAIANGEGEDATNVYKPRNLSIAGTRLFFDSRDALVSQDTSVAQDVYEWEAKGIGTCQKLDGCVSLISDGKSAEASSFIDASADGRDALFLTADSLVPSDPGSVDLYDAREGGGFAVPMPPSACEGDACQSVPSPPEDTTPGTLVPGPPNPALHFPKAHHKKPKRHQHKKHHGKRGAR